MLGSASDGFTASYTLTGGTYSVGSTATNNGLSFILGAGTSGTSQTTLTLGGTGKLIVAGRIYGNQAGGTNGLAQQLFNFNGGTLVAGTITMGNLATSASPTVTGTLYNNGGTIAPGDIGIPGKTIITGAYTVTSPSAALDIDIAGQYPPSTWQMPGGELRSTSGQRRGKRRRGLEPELGQRLRAGYRVEHARSNVGRSYRQLQQPAQRLFADNG